MDWVEMPMLCPSSILSVRILHSPPDNMIATDSVMQDPSSTDSTDMTTTGTMPLVEPAILANLPTVLTHTNECPRRTRTQLDLLLLAIEALDLTGSEAILAVIDELELHTVIPHRAMLWRLRSTNPMRRMSQRQGMTLTEAKAMTVVACYLSRRLTAVLRQLVLEYQLLGEAMPTSEQNPRLVDYLERYRSLFRSRMHPRRTATLYDSDPALDQLALAQLSRLLFCTGTAGMQRLWISLFDGEVA
jgi:hypothetical protein